MEKAYIFALGANLSFAIGIQFFTHYARNLSSVWVNCFKAIVAIVLFLATIFIKGGFNSISYQYILFFAASGFIGLGLADIFLLKSFSIMGPGRTMVIFSFQPLFVGVLSYFIFAQTVSSRKFIAVIFLVICLVIFSLESFKKHGHWNIKSTFFAFCAMLFDGTGVIITRYAFDNCKAINTVEGNFYRAIGAILLFIILAKARPFGFIKRYKSLSPKGKFLITLGAVLGTYISLILYLNAVRYAGALAIITSISITGTFFAAILECIVDKKPPSIYLITAFAFFLIGMRFLFF
jgi:drug/metabolite transporter (DMT)-like permease